MNPKPTDDPHDFVVVSPDHVRVAPSDDEISDLLRAAARYRADSQAGSKPDLSAASPVPPLDTTFRPTDVNNDLLGRRRAIGRRVTRALVALLLAACVGAAAVVWQASGYAFKKMAFKWLPKVAVTASLPLEKLGLTSPSTAPDAEPADPEAEPQQTASTVPSASESAGAKAAETGQTPDSALSIQSMARDLAGVGQEVEALKASIAELKASQQQMARELAKANELNARAKLTSVQPRPVAAPPVRKPAPPYAPSPPTAAAPAYRPTPSYPPTQAAGPPPVPPAVQPYAARPVETLPPPPADSGLASAPRPPMPVQ